VYKRIGQDPVLPLNLCEGDCDSDDECMGSFVCYQRDYYFPSPGCSGVPENSRDDYCVAPPLKDNGWNPVLPLGLCEGDCDSNDECMGDLVCFLRNNYEPVPMCSGGSGGDRSGYDYCIMPPLKEFGWNPVLPLDLCEGDCDSDDECMGSLECFTRNDLTHVPGCYGDGVSDYDYCITPPVYVLNPYKDTWANHEATAVRCGGHLASVLNTDEMRQITYGTWTGAYQKQPCNSEPFGCWHWSDGSAFPNPNPLWDIDEPNDWQGGNEDCGERSKNSGRLRLNDLPCDSLQGGTYTLRPDYDVKCMNPPLKDFGLDPFYVGLCEGDCDTNDDCIGSLVCFQRDGFEPVPGCFGPGSFTFDYCIIPP